LDLKAELFQIHFVPLEHPSERDVVFGGVVIDLFPQDRARKAHPGIEQGKQEIQESFSAGCGHACYVTKVLGESSKARHRPAKPEGNAPWQEACALADSYEVNDEKQALGALDCSARALW